MGDWPRWADGGLTSITSMQTAAGRAADMTGNSPGSATWPSANRSLIYGFLVEAPIVVTQAAWENGATLAGNVDVGVYDLAGTRLVSTGAVAQAGASVVQVADVTDTRLNPGAYYMAMSASSASATFSRAAPPVMTLRATGALRQDAGHPLPSPATFAVCTDFFMPVFALITVAVV